MPARGVPAARPQWTNDRGLREVRRHVLGSFLRALGCRGLPRYAILPPAMTRKRLLRAICYGLLLAASAVPAGAQPAGMQRVTDSKGRFAISFPIGWEVMSMNANMLTGEVTRNLPKDFFSMLMAVDPANPESP